MSSIPEGYTTVTPTLIVNGAAKAIELYKMAFGAKELYRMETSDKSKVMHACIQIGNSKLFLSDMAPKMGDMKPSSASFYLYLDDVDAAFRQARQAGMEEITPVQDMFWGDRVGNVQDAFGMRWTLATHVRDVSSQELEKAAKEMAAKAA